METVEQYLKAQKMAEIETNYQAAKEFLTVGPNKYRITYENITDINGLITLGMGSKLGVEVNGELQLVDHSLQQLKDLLEAIRVHLTSLKTNRFNKREALKALEDHAVIRDFDTSI